MRRLILIWISLLWQIIAVKCDVVHHDVFITPAEREFIRSFYQALDSFKISDDFQSPEAIIVKSMRQHRETALKIVDMLEQRTTTEQMWTTNPAKEDTSAQTSTEAIFTEFVNTVTNANRFGFPHTDNTASTTERSLTTSNVNTEESTHSTTSESDASYSEGKISSKALESTMVAAIEQADIIKRMRRFVDPTKNKAPPLIVSRDQTHVPLNNFQDVVLGSRHKSRRDADTEDVKSTTTTTTTSDQDSIHATTTMRSEETSDEYGAFREFDASPEFAKRSARLARSIGVSSAELAEMYRELNRFAKRDLSQELKRDQKEMSAVDAAEMEEAAKYAAATSTTPGSYIADLEQRHKAITDILMSSTQTFTHTPTESRDFASGEEHTTSKTLHAHSGRESFDTSESSEELHDPPRSRRHVPSDRGDLELNSALSGGSQLKNARLPSSQQKFEKAVEDIVSNMSPGAIARIFNKFYCKFMGID